MIEKVGVACVLHNRDDIRMVLLGKRSKPDGLGLWVLPGGSMDPGETPGQTVLRESYEEVDVKFIDAPAQLYFDWNTRQDGTGFLMLYYTAMISKAGVRLKAAHEFSDLQWFSVDKLPAEMWKEDRDAVERSARYWELP